MKKYLWIILLFISAVSFSQKPKEIDAINTYISFINESIHGMLIAHRLFEGYNQTINKYVGLPDYQLNNYTNADLPDDIFQDPEKWFYNDRNPYQWHKKAKKKIRRLSIHRDLLRQKALRITELLKSTNELRLKIENDIERKDLSKKKEISSIYHNLLKLETIFDEFYIICHFLHEFVNDNYWAYKKTNSYTSSFSSLHNKVWDILLTLRSEKSIQEAEVTELSEIYNELKDKVIHSRKGDKFYSRDSDRIHIISKITEIINVLRDYESNSLPVQFEQYGKFYYVYNVQVLNYTNRYGNGYAGWYNQVAKDNGWILELEIPHIYTLVYPENWSKND